VGNEEQPTTIGMSDNNQAFLVNGVIWVEESNRKVIIKHGGGFKKRNAMPDNVYLGFVVIPIKLQALIMTPRNPK